jgi:hypothetical protein
VGGDHCWVNVPCVVVLGNFESPLGSFKKLMRTSGESFANSMGTLWEHQNSKKSKPLKNQLWNHLEE